MNKWLQRVDKMKIQFDLTSDAQAAKMLGISQQAMSRIRNGEKEMGPVTKMVLMDRLGFTNLREVLLEVLPEEKKTVVKGKWNELIKRTQKVIDDNKE